MRETDNSFTIEIPSLLYGKIFSHRTGTGLGMLELLLGFLEEGFLNHHWCIFVGLIGASTVKRLNYESIFGVFWGL